MKTKFYHLLIALTLLAHSTLHAQNTMFTYQGHVLDNGTNFTGTGQFEFALVTSTNFNQTATGTANAPSGGFITGYMVTASGSGYVTAPVVTVSGGGGAGAAATAHLTGSSVTSISVANPGNGSYASAPTVTIAPPPPNIAYTTYWSNDGTSSAGSEPAAAVGVTVTNGLFSVVLGDTTLANMTAISASLFAQPNLQLLIWFNDGVHGFAGLSPVQNLTATPYAAVAQLASSFSGLSVQQNSNGAPNIIGGSTVNFVAGGVVGATIGGGGATNYFGPGYTNSVTADFGTVGGGYANIASGIATTVSGGSGNIASGQHATVSGGFQNTASGPGSFVGGGGYDGVIQDTSGNIASGAASVIGGGVGNQATNNEATVGGGSDNTASGYGSTVPGGGANVASGYNSFAAGSNARAVHDGSFVWADFSLGGGYIAPFFSTNANQFSVRATGGVRFVTAIDTTDINGTPTAGVSLASGGTSWATISDRNAKKNFQAVNTEIVLDKLAAIPIQQWNYKWEKDSDVPNIGPMAQDFKHAFYPGRDDKSITTLEFDGVELAAIQGLNQKLQETRAQNAKLEQQNDSLAERLDELEATVKSLAEKK